MPDLRDIDVGHVIGRPPRRTIEHFRSKGWAISWNWPEVWQQQHLRAFTVAKATKLALLRDIRREADRMIAEGRTLRDAGRDLEAVMRRHGWWGRQELVNPVTGEVELVQLGSPHRIRTILRTNARTASAAARYQAQRDNAAARPYWMYDALEDGRTRPQHLALDNMVFRHDDPFWDTHYPPNGWNCRCRVQALTRRDVERRGLEVSRSSPGDFSPVEHTVTGGHQVETTSWRGIMSPDPGWNYRPGLPAPRPQGPLGPSGSVGGAGWIDSLGGEIDLGGWFAPAGAAAATWRSLGLPAWRDVSAVPAAPRLVAAGATTRERKRILVERLAQEGFEPELLRRPDGRRDAYLAAIQPPGGLDPFVVSYQGIRYLVDNHRAGDARERFADYVLPTIRQPSEVWLQGMADGAYRRVFLGRFADDRNVVVVDHWDGAQEWILWTFYPSGSAPNSRRHGQLLYARP